MRDTECEKCKVNKYCGTCITCEQAKEMYQQGRADAVDEVSRAMYHQCFECNNDEDMQKWDSGNWIRYKLFENVIEQFKEQEK